MHITETEEESEAIQEETGQEHKLREEQDTKDFTELQEFQKGNIGTEGK